MNLTEKLYCGLGICAAMALTSCGKVPPVQDLTNIPEFHQLLNASDGQQLSTDEECNIDLYVDYSTCVSEALSSPYYQAVHPAIVDCGPAYYSIKGNVVKEETRDKQTVYQLLRSVREVNNADIKQAVERIVSSGRQAVLITDGEYSMPVITGDNLNNPYLAESFRRWLNQGHDIYIYSEPYVESGRFSKFRYYMIFTDRSIENNLQQRFDRSAPKDERVKMFHLTTGTPSLAFDKEYPVVNPCLSLNTQTAKRYGNFEVQEYQTEWETIYDYILKNAVDNMGNPLPKGDFITRGLFVAGSENDAYKIKELEAVTYNVYPAYQELADSIAAGGTLPACRLESPVSGVFVVDNDILQQTGEVVIRLNPQFDGSTLSVGMPNLLKVDLVMKDVAENFTGNDELNRNFKWQSISARNQGRDNTSIYESIRQVLMDPSVNPVKKGGVIYTFYLNTFGM